MNRATASRIQTGRKGQRGAVLVFCLVFLAILTLMAVTGMDTAVVEERMAGNMQDYNQAFQAAEVGLIQAEGWLAARTTLPTASSTGATSVWTLDSPDATANGVNWWLERPSDWWGTNAISVAGLEVVNTQPGYVIEEFFTSTTGQSLAIGTGEQVSTRILHRVTARGTGASDNAEVLLQSTYVRPYD